ncbi:NTP transferase domain-containing protein [bacterium]|nr:NTP transferase domain-containing protein [candidate division CSSED10-310 bacterium]
MNGVPAHRRIVGVILAAGRGDRLKPLSFHAPKPLLPICNKPILEYQVEAMRSVGITDIYMVVGHLSNMIIQHFGDGRRHGVDIQYIHQEKPLGIAHAVAQLEPHIDAPFLMFLGDIFLITKDLDSMLARFRKERPGAILGVKQETNQEFIKRNFTVQLDERGWVRKVIEKPRFVTNNLKGCGIYLFDLPVFDAIRQTPRTAMRDEYEITTSIQIMIDDGYRVQPAEVVSWDMNVTVPCDLLTCNRKQLEVLGAANCIAGDAVLNEGVVTSGSVIGGEAIIAHPIQITDSLIFPRVNVTTRSDLANVLVTADTIITCHETR